MSAFDKLRVEIYGESHGDLIGLKLYGLPKNFKVDIPSLTSFVERRKSGNNSWSTPRREGDSFEFLSGINEDMTDGDVLEVVIKNTDKKSEDYNELAYTPRPSHADYVATVKDGVPACPKGGGRFSGRLTAPLVVAGGIAKQILEERGIEVLSYIRKIGEISGESYLTEEITAEDIKRISTPLKALSNAYEMEQEVLSALKDGDSVGGIVDVIVYGVPVGLGDNLFDGLEGKLSQAVFGVPAVKGVEFGRGFQIAALRGSEANDPFVYDGEKVVTQTNNSGGINGGISNGMPITMSVAIRPTPSIAKSQRTVNLKTKENVEIEIKGRHDACIVPRGAVAIEAAVALAILDEIL